LKGAVCAWSLRRWDRPYRTTDGRRKERGSMGGTSADRMRGKEEAEEPKPPPNGSNGGSNGRRRRAGAGLSAVRSVRTMPNVRDDKQVRTDLESRH
jgi:hypothetical protein